MPYFLVFEFLSPVFALLGLVVTTVWFLLGGLSLAYFLAFLTVSIGLGLLLTTAALALEEFSYRRYRRRGEVVRLLAYAVLENVGYRQLHDAWRAMGYVDIARGKKGWGAQQRRGFARPASRRQTRVRPDRHAHVEAVTCGAGGLLGAARRRQDESACAIGGGTAVGGVRADRRARLGAATRGDRAGATNRRGDLPRREPMHDRGVPARRHSGRRGSTA